MLPHSHPHGPEGVDSAGQPAAAPSVLRALNAVQHRLEHFQHAPPHGDPADLRATARALLHAVDLSADVALACVLRNQVAGSYAMRHSIETAVIVALVGRRLRMRPAHLLSLVSAALALHATGRHDQPVAQAVHCTRASEPDWFACLLLDHAPDTEPAGDVKATAHLLRMADRYCACISPRNYRRALLADDALARVLEQSPDPELTAAFRDEIGAYPPGTVVRLDSGEWGIVAHRDGGVPTVFCLRHADGRTFTVPLPRRVGADGCAISAALGDEDSDIRVPMKLIWGALGSL